MNIVTLTIIFIMNPGTVTIMSEFPTMAACEEVRQVHIDSINMKPEWELISDECK